jgi:rubrerythrin
MPKLEASQTSDNLKSSFAEAAQASRRYLYFARRADVEGQADAAGLFRDMAEGEANHAQGSLDFLREVGDPATGKPFGTTQQNLLSAIADESYQGEQMYHDFAATARNEGFEEIAEWFETLARAERSHAERFRQLYRHLFED